MPSVRSVAIYLMVALGLERALRAVRMHRRTRVYLTAGTLGAAWTAHWYSLPVNSRTTVRRILHNMEDASINELYLLLIGLYFMYQLESAPTMNFWPGHRNRLYHSHFDD